MIIGAGASKEFGLPTGDELKQQIARALDIRYDLLTQSTGARLIKSAFTVAAEKQTGSLDIGPYLSQAHRIRGALLQAISIDNLLDAHKGNNALELCGKLAIAISILSAERNSNLWIDARARESRLPFEHLKKSWAIPFWQILTENCEFSDLPDRLARITVITFNYDRCIEHFLYESIQNYFGVEPDAAARVLECLTIFHVYGRVGPLPWQCAIDSIPYGGEPSPEQLFRLALGIRTFTEGTDPKTSDIRSIRQRYASAEKVLFLGFGFHRLNLEVFCGDNNPHIGGGPVRYYATATGISNSDCDAIKRELGQLCEIRAEYFEIRNDLYCHQIFSEYWRSLTWS
ncbi:MAG: hypothetical protein GKR94_28520 [Gammaproteobacteria bacterium]|nr:hypothetical protein [Gammaproteobacteria bacterium]